MLELTCCCATFAPARASITANWRVTGSPRSARFFFDSSASRPSIGPTPPMPGTGVMWETAFFCRDRLRTAQTSPNRFAFFLRSIRCVMRLKPDGSDAEAPSSCSRGRFILPCPTRTTKRSRRASVTRRQVLCSSRCGTRHGAICFVQQRAIVGAGISLGADERRPRRRYSSLGAGGGFTRHPPSPCTGESASWP